MCNILIINRTMEYVTLNNGVKMPMVGLGTFNIPLEKMVDVVGNAYKLGYRQFDTAWKYRNEGNIARALKVNGIKRENVFITTKVDVDALYYWGYHYGKRGIFNVRSFKSIRKAIEESFEHLGTDYIDLFLVHWPYPIYRKMYKELESFYREGRIRAIGVCSCLPPHLEALKEVSDIVPAVNQFEISPLNTQKKLIKYCQERGIAVEAMSTFSHFRSSVPRQEIFGNDILQSIAEKYQKSVSQIVLRWLVQQGIIVIPKTCNMTHLQENISLFDFELTVEEMSRIDSLDGGKFLNYNPYNALKGLPRKYREWSGFVCN